MLPQTEKRLYDNSQLAHVYLRAWNLNPVRIQAVTGNEFFRTVAEEFLNDEVFVLSVRS